MINSEFYPYVLAAHITAVVFLVGSMLAQDRILTAIAHYPREQQIGTLAALLGLDRQITTPALLITWLLGLTLAISARWLRSHWLMIKLVIVVALSALHGLQSGRLRRLIRAGESAKGLARASISIFIAMSAIAILAIVKPI